ncbi:MAG: CDP-diacylglycerol--serine O-phosphatidyltransferase [Pedobacter sp.]|nr:MAG: CDP-diacylglycerol--serine O-phosphatidyltransferase [Pedobacter sp.]
MIKQIPNAITCANLFSGCIGIVYAFNGNLTGAAYFVLLSGLFDFFDGFAARLLKVKSEMGKELDSLADVVSFGFLPGVVLYQMLLVVYPLNSFIPFFAFFVTIFSALRLAKFNIDTRQSNDFIGLNTPMNTLVTVSFPFLANTYPDLIYNPITLVIWIAISCILLISEIRFFSLKFEGLSWGANKFKFSFLFLTLVAIILWQFKSAPIILALYMLFSLMHFGKKIMAEKIK